MCGVEDGWAEAAGTATNGLGIRSTAMTPISTLRPTSACNTSCAEACEDSAALTRDLQVVMRHSIITNGFDVL